MIHIDQWSIHKPDTSIENVNYDWVNKPVIIGDSQGSVIHYKPCLNRLTTMPLLVFFAWKLRKKAAKKGIKEDASRIESFNEKNAMLFDWKWSNKRPPLWKCSPAFLHQIVNLTQYDISHFFVDKVCHAFLQLYIGQTCVAWWKITSTFHT